MLIKKKDTFGEARTKAAIKSSIKKLESALDSWQATYDANIGRITAENAILLHSEVMTKMHEGGAAYTELCNLLIQDVKSRASLM